MTASAASHLLQIGVWQVDPTLDEIRRDERVIKLEPRTMRLLCCLAERPGEVFSVDELLDKVWPGVVVNQNSVYQAVAQLRKLLGDVGPEPQYVTTVPRKGYRLIAPVCAATRSSTPLHAAAPPPQPVQAENPARDPLMAHSRKIALALAGLVAVTLLTIWTLAPSRVAPMPGTSELAAIVVLPFADLSADGGNVAFCDGLTEELLNSLARVPGLRVTGRTSAFRARDQRIDVPQLGKLLGVTHVLEGSVRVTQGRLRVTAQLVSTQDGFQVWSNSFDRPRAEVIGIQTDISRAVVDSLALKLSAETRAGIGRAPTTEVNSYELYLLGRHQQLQRNPEALTRAVSYFEQAIAADPKFALAHAGLADAYMAGYYYQNRSLEETAPLVQREVDRALKLDPELAEGYAAWAVLLTEQWRMDEAITALERAISINPNYGDAYLRLGAAYEYSGRLAEALEAYDQVAALDPLHTQLHVRRCVTLQNMGRYAQADRACQRGFELQPEIPNALWAHALSAYGQGDLVAAIERYTQALARAPHRADLRAEIALLYLDVGLIEQARHAFEVEMARAEGARAADFVLAHARMFAAAGDRAGLARTLRATDWSGESPRARLDAALLASIAEDQGQAAALVQSALGNVVSSEDDIHPGLYKVRWGVCEMCSLALLERAHGDASNAERYTSLVLAWFEKLERNGHHWHGLHYLRATLLAQRGENDAALASLERSVALGWRRAWLMRVDPALKPLQAEARFVALLEKIDAANALARARLQAESVARN